MSKKAAIVGFVSGKGGVGKTSIVANLAISAARRGQRVLAVDGDLGLSSLDVFLGLAVERTIAHVLVGDCSLEEAIVEGPSGIHVLAAASGRSDLVCLDPHALARLLVPLFALRSRYDLILLDAGPGISPTVVSLALACDRLVLVTTPEPTSLADAYATLKVVSRERCDVAVEVLVNQVRDSREAQDTHARLGRVARRFLNLELPLLGDLSKDSRFEEAAKLQSSVIRAFPSSAPCREIKRLSDRLQDIRERPAREVAVDLALEA
jgi:flagellar biosynthesis protein FlhG